eukprot:CAMPEP_0170551880 /NCGR_PEP_ID=MMETSP0211-20121228/9873_1 /TAXON_ID=311385 /ORGANISM="Pseudokeronopsis sp., Strain OXSARD2" /LENGTH=105 /DNA_ID=CAMNT_0010859325 /DNA_START=728 /DNA_END=1045 /DNA_ORIENTATION=+
MAVLKDSWFMSFLNVTTLYYYQTAIDKDLEGTTGSLIQGDILGGFVFSLDTNVEATERTNMTLFDALAQTGGIMGFIFITLELLLKSLQESFYYAELLSQLFYFE